MKTHQAFAVLCSLSAALIAEVASAQEINLGALQNSKNIVIVQLKAGLD